MLVCLVDPDGPEMGRWARIWLLLLARSRVRSFLLAPRRVGNFTATGGYKGLLSTGLRDR
jgi:hypothetical protein